MGKDAPSTPLQSALDGPAIDDQVQLHRAITIDHALSRVALAGWPTPFLARFSRSTLQELAARLATPGNSTADCFKWLCKRSRKPLSKTAFYRFAARLAREVDAVHRGEPLRIGRESTGRTSGRARSKSASRSRQRG